MRIPLTRMYYDDILIEKCGSVLKSGRLIDGPESRALESNWANYCGAEYAVAVNSGTSALLAVLLALKRIRNIRYKGGRNPSVILPSHTFAASCQPIVAAGFRPVFAEILEDIYSLDPDDVARLLAEKNDIEGIIAVDLYGHPAEMKRLKRLADDYGIFLVEDACQAHGALYYGCKPGAFADAAVYSFYPSKNISAMGPGGIITTDNSELAEICRAVIDYGRTPDGTDCVIEGINGRPSELHSAMVNVQISLLDEWNKKRIRLAELYGERLGDLEFIRLPVCRSYAVHVYHLFVIRVPSEYRDRLITFLNDKGIEARIHYPIPLHRQTFFSRFSDRMLEVTERITDSIISLPIGQFITEEEVREVSDRICEFFTLHPPPKIRMV